MKAGSTVRLATFTIWNRTCKYVLVKLHRNPLEYELLLKSPKLLSHQSLLSRTLLRFSQTKLLHLLGDELAYYIKRTSVKNSLEKKLLPLTLVTKMKVAFGKWANE